MKTRYLLAALLCALASPLHAQVTPDSVRVELVRARGFVRAAETQFTKTLALLDSVIASGMQVDTVRLPGDTVLVVDTVYVAQPTPDEPVEPSDTVPPPAPPDTTTPTPPPPPAGATRRNMPAGFTVVSDYGFGDTLPPHQNKTTSGVLYDRWQLGTSGWNVVSWGTPGGGIQRELDPTAPVSPQGVIANIYPGGARGGGGSFYRSVPSSDETYVSWIVKWDADFEHNSNSEKLIYFNHGASDYFLFQFHWGSESIYNVKPLPEDEILAGDNSIRANRAGRDSRGRPYAPPIDGEWVEYEFVFNCRTGEVRWWTNGVLQAHHFGRTFPCVTGVYVSDTWGGGGQHALTRKRYTDHMTIAVR